VEHMLAKRQLRLKGNVGSLPSKSY